MGAELALGGLDQRQAQEVQRLAPYKLLALRRRLGLLMLDRLVW